MQKCEYNKRDCLLYRSCIKKQINGLILISIKFLGMWEAKKLVNVIICEFNPFHNGHKYLISEAKRVTGAYATVCLMSGNFVQRGQAAIECKHRRAKAAVLGGADLVLQIPSAYVLGGAEVFAGAGVSMAAALKVPSTLVFGAEDTDTDALISLARLGARAVNIRIKAGLKRGLSYARAVYEAYFSLDPVNAPRLLKPNNLLAFEYIKAIIKNGAGVGFKAIARKGAGHDSDDTSGEFASASYIRAHLDTAQRFMPGPVTDEIDRLRFEQTALFALKSASAAMLRQCAGVEKGFENRIIWAAKKALSLDEFYRYAITKRCTLSRLRRVVISVMVKNPMGLCFTELPYLRVLAFNDTGRRLLKSLKGRCTKPVIVKPADTPRLGLAGRHFTLEERCTDIYNFLRVQPVVGGRECLDSPIYIEKGSCGI